jgi:hypothetical protein
MKGLIRPIALTALCAGMGLPLRAQAQDPTPVGVANQVTPAPVASAPKEPPVSPVQHLDNARQALEQMPSSLRRADLRQELAGLRQTFAEMMSAYASSASATARTKDQPGPIDWQAKFFDVERQLAALIGGSSLPVLQPIGSAAAPGSPDSGHAAPASGPNPTRTTDTVGVVTSATASVGTTASTAATEPSIPPAPPRDAIVSPNGDLRAPDGSAPPRPTGTSGTSAPSTPTGASATGDGNAAVSRPPAAVAPATEGEVPPLNGRKDVDPALREALERFRLHVELFFDSTTVDQH